MQRRTKLIILIVIGLLLIIGIIVFVVLNGKESPAPKIDETAPVAKLEEVKKEEPTLIQPIETESENVAKSVKTVAVAFVERFGTFTNDSNFKSIRDLDAILTDSMSSWIDEVYLPKLEKEYAPNGFFYRITAKAPVVQVIENTETTAKVKVTAQREETRGTEAPRAFLQNIILDLVSVNNVWLVDAAYWQKEE